MYRAAYKSRDDLKEFGDNGLLLFALILKFGFDDISAIAAESLTDGPDDKKADLILIDQNSGHAIIAQGYYATKEKKEAPANKASDLNTAVGWILTREIDELPVHLQSPSRELREAIKNGDVSTIEAWYVHNLPESENCADELKTVESTLASIVKDYYPENDISVLSAEIGHNTLNDWYEMTQSPILVNDDFSFTVPGGFEIESTDWKAISTAIHLNDLYKIFNLHGKNIFSANIRDYLGTRKSDSNINYGIKKTAEETPDKFCVYNNGITAITHSYVLENKTLKIKGISIVNGAQTTGSIGNLKSEPNENAIVSCRFIRCDSHDTILNIVRYNNSQNKTTAMDFRSNDSIQDRLRREFDEIGDNVYLGGRRGGIDDAIKRKSNLIPSDTVAQTLSAFHGFPNIAYNKKSDIWNKDDLYTQVFNDMTSARHIIFSYSLFNSIKKLKLSLFAKLKSGTDMLDTESAKLDFLRMRGSNYILISAISACLEIILGKKIPNLFRLSFIDSIKIDDAESLWDSIINVSIPFSSTLTEVTKKSLRVPSENQAAVGLFRSLIESTSSANKSIFEAFTSKVIIN